MDYRNLGRSGLKVSRLCLGTMMFGGATDEPTAQRIIAKAREAGVNFIDSADADRTWAASRASGSWARPTRAYAGSALTISTSTICIRKT